MPNHVKNRVTLIGDAEEIKKLRDTIRSGTEEGEHPRPISFDNIIPMPPSLDIQSGSTTSMAAAILGLPSGSQFGYSDTLRFYRGCGWAQKDLGDDINDDEKLKAYLKSKINEDEEKADELIAIVKHNIEEHGCLSWYEWRNRHWGTKWDAYDCAEGDDDTTFSFETAWAHPEPVFEKLSEMFPNVKIIVRYADEDIGSNCGVAMYHNGSGTFEAGNTDFALDIWEYDKDEYYAEMEDD